MLLRVCRVILNFKSKIGLFTYNVAIDFFMQWMNPYYSTKYVDFEQQNEWTLAIQLEVRNFSSFIFVIDIFSKTYGIIAHDRMGGESWRVWFSTF
jgi:hypothetical protein